MKAHASIDQNRLCDESISVFHAEGSLIDDYYYLCRTIHEEAEEKGLSHAFVSPIQPVYLGQLVESSRIERA